VEQSTWLFPDEPTAIGSTTALLRVFADEAEMNKALGTAGAAGSMGLVRVTFEGKTYEWPLEQCRAAPVPLGDTSLTLRVADYFPHANVGPGGTLHSASDRPENPAIRVEFDGPNGSFERLAFAKFPDFSMRKPSPDEPNVKVTFDFQGGQGESPIPIELAATVDGAAYVRFASGAGPTSLRPVELNEPTDTPWPGMKLTVKRSLDRARKREVLAPFESLRETRQPGVLVALRSGDEREELWLPKYQTRRIMLGGRRLDVGFGDQRFDLGFKIALDDFTIRYYPGTRRPRSFESRITITDPTGDTMTRLVSMNNPVEYNGYTFFQSSYQGETISILSMARDPGLPVVYAGYFGLMGGMVLVLITRARSRAVGGSNGAMQRSRGVGASINLLANTDRCLNGEPLPAAGQHEHVAADTRPTSAMKQDQRNRVNS